MSKLTEKQTAQIAFMFSTLNTIAKGYQTPNQLRKASEKDWGCTYEDALEMAYENMQEAAKRAIKGVSIKAIIEKLN